MLGVRAFSFDGVSQDTRYAFRVIRKRPGFSALVIATLALGIGVNTTSVAVGYGLLVRPLPYDDPSRVVILNRTFIDGGDLGFSPFELQDWLPRLRTIETAAAYYRREVTVRAAGRSTVAAAAFVTDEFFDVLGTPVEFGRQPSPDRPQDVVVGRRWLNQFLPGTISESVGASVSVGDTPYTIGGIMPSDFAFPNDEIGIWLPSTVLIPGTRAENSGSSRMVARVKAGATLAQVREDADRIRREIEDSAKNRGAVPVPTIVSAELLGESVVGGLRPLLMATLGGALLVFLVACANAATLFIGRDVTRQRERAVRVALGATRSQLVRSVLVETSITAAIASFVGVALGAVMLQFFVSRASATVPGLHRVALGFPIALAIAILTAIASFGCALVPAWLAVRGEFTRFVPTATSRPSAWRIRSTLVVAQIGLSCVLLIGAGLLTRTVSVLLKEDHGFLPSGALEAKVVLSDTVLPKATARDRFVPELLERVRMMRGVQDAGFGASLPSRPPLLTVLTRMVTASQDETRFVSVVTATPGYLRALGARFVRGRDFDEAENRSGAAVVIVSESAARFYFQDDDPIGRTIARLPTIVGTGVNYQVVGVVSDIKYQSLDLPAPSALYVPWNVRPAGSGYLIVRASSGDAVPLAPTIRRAMQDLDPTVPVPELQTLDDVIAQSISSRRVRALPAVGFGVLSLAVTFVGVLATLLTHVAERRRDLAIRAAIGASPARLTWTVVKQGLALTTLGLAVGFALGVAAARSFSSLIYGISPYDELTFTGTAIVIGGGATLLTYVAARRARSIDPIVVLKHD